MNNFDWDTILNSWGNDKPATMHEDYVLDGVYLNAKGKDQEAHTVGMRVLALEANT